MKCGESWPKVGLCLVYRYCKGERARQGKSQVRRMQQGAVRVQSVCPGFLPVGLDLFGGLIFLLFFFLVTPALGSRAVSECCVAVISEIEIQQIEFDR